MPTAQPFDGKFRFPGIFAFLERGAFPPLYYSLTIRSPASSTMRPRRTLLEHCRDSIKTAIRRTSPV